MPNIRLPDGSQKPFDKPVTVAEVAASIGAGLAKAALAGKVDGKLVDTSHTIDRDADVTIVTEKDPAGLDMLRHSAAHLLAHAVKELYPDAQVTIGPVIEDGFYYDFSYKRPFTPDDLAAIEKRMGQQMRCRVADEFDAVGALVGDDRQRRVALDAVRQVDQLAVNAPAERGLGEAGTDRGRHLAHRHRCGELAFRAIGQLK
jgi:hypothetical protein